jgi:hypothetical protein
MTDRRTALARQCVGSALMTLGIGSANAVSETEASLQISYRNGSQRTLTFNDLNGLTQHSIVTATPWHLGTWVPLHLQGHCCEMYYSWPTSKATLCWPLR